MKIFRVLIISGLLMGYLSGLTENITVGKTDDKFISVEDAMRKNLISIEIRSTGGHSGECIEVKLENLSHDSLFLLVEPGRKLVSYDTTTQDILITRDEYLMIAGRQSHSLSIFGFCCESSMNSPYDSSLFSLGQMADSALVALACFLNENDFPLDACQDAVWALSDDHDLAYVHDDDPDKINDLVDFVAKLKGVERPWYSLENQASENSVYSPKVSYISAVIQIYIPRNGFITVNITDESGNVMEVFEYMEPYQPGAFEYSFKIPVIDWPCGTYYFNLIMDSAPLYRKRFDI